jgi:alanine dehydrogenase
VLEIADHGLRGAIERDPGLRPGVNVAGGKITHPAVAEGTGLPFAPLEESVLSPQSTGR